MKYSLRSLMPKRSWFQFSLKALLVVMAGCCVLLAVFGWRLQRARKQAEAVATLQELQASVMYDFEIQAIQQSRPGLPQSSWPLFMVQWLGKDFFHDVYVVNTAGLPGQTYNTPQQTPSNRDKVRFWDCVAQFPHLHQLMLAGDWMDHDGLARIRSPQEMETLGITNFPATDDDLRIAGTMTKLKTLQIYGTTHSITYPITDAGIAALDNLSELEAIILGPSQITDDAAPHLAKHKKMGSLQLVGNRLTDRSTPSLGQLTELSRLSLIEAEIGDTGCENLKNLPKLEYLVISSSKVTDEGLLHLANVTTLKSLIVKQTKVTSQGIAQFNQRLPACRVYQ